MNNFEPPKSNLLALAKISIPKNIKSEERRKWKLWRNCNRKYKKRKPLKLTWTGKSYRICLVCADIWKKYQCFVRFSTISAILKSKNYQWRSITFCSFTKHDTPPRVLFMFFESCKWYQSVKSITYYFLFSFQKNFSFWWFYLLKNCMPELIWRYQVSSLF